jgi:hypothetical protein
MARFLSSLGAALQIAANDQASPEAGLLEGKANSQFQKASYGDRSSKIRIR